jgi:hypothetical protein
VKPAILPTPFAPEDDLARLRNNIVLDGGFHRIPWFRGRVTAVPDAFRDGL